jgi:hypothetical protein
MSLFLNNIKMIMVYLYLMDVRLLEIEKGFAELVAKSLMPDTSRLEQLSDLKGTVDMTVDADKWQWSMPLPYSNKDVIPYIR